MPKSLPARTPFSLLMVAILLTGTAGAQDAAAPAPAPTADKSPAAASPAPSGDAPKDTGPSAATLKAARQAGLHPETKNGVTMFCWEDANIGTRFKTKKCVDESRLGEVLEQRQLLQEQMRRSGCGGSACGGAK